MSEKLTVRIPAEGAETSRPSVPKVVVVNQERLNERSRKNKPPRIDHAID